MLRLDRPLISPFGASLTHLKLPRWMAPRNLPNGELTLAVLDDGRLRLGERTYTYDRYGLQLLREDMP